MTRSDTPLLRWLYGRRRLGWRLRLDNLRDALADLGHPQKSVPAVHVGGTNGKGSTAALIQSALSEAGYRTGLFLSPHLLSFRERIRIDRRLIASAELEGLLVELRPLIEARELTFFESATLLALVHFQRREVDLAVFEVGLGGRLDATNLVEPLVTVITNVGRDHLNILGDDLEKIAGEKLGILKPGVPLVIGDSGPDPVLRRLAEERGAEVFDAGRLVTVERSELRPDGLTLDLRTPGGPQPGIPARMTGCHQVRNVATAFLALDLIEKSGRPVPGEARRRGFRRCFLPGRFQLLGSRPRLLLDGAHNPDALRELRRSLESILKWKRIVMVFGVLADKPFTEMLAVLDGLPDLAVLTRPPNERALDLDRLEAEVKALGWQYRRAADPGRALRSALALAEPEDILLVTGSLFLVGHLLASRRLHDQIYLDRHRKTNLNMDSK